MSDLTYLYVAYTIIWAGLFGFAVRLYLQQRSLRRELDTLKEVVDGATDD